MPKIAYKRTLSLDTGECSAVSMLGITALAKTGATRLERSLFGKPFTVGIAPFFIGSVEAGFCVSRETSVSLGRRIGGSLTPKPFAVPSKV